MLSVIHVITGLSRGGAEAMLVKLLAASDMRRFKHHVISLTDAGVHGEGIMALGASVDCLGMRRGVSTPDAMVRLRQIVRRTGPQLVHGWMYHGMLAGLAAAQGRPVIAAIRHSLYDLADEKIKTRLVVHACARLSGRFARIVYNSELARTQHELLGFSGARPIVIPNGFDTELLKPDPDRRRRMRAALGLEEGQVAVVHLARLHPMKDHAGLLASIREIDDPRFVFLLAGTGVTYGNPPFCGTLDTRIRLLGERDDIPDLLQGADLLVNPSWSEAFPNVLGEAMACGVPCVATDVGDSALIVDDTGFIVPARDPQALTDAIRRMAAYGSEGRHTLGLRARDRVIERFSITEVVRVYERLYETVIERGAQKER